MWQEATYVPTNKPFKFNRVMVDDCMMAEEVARRTGIDVEKAFYISLCAYETDQISQATGYDEQTVEKVLDTLDEIWTEGDDGSDITLEEVEATAAEFLQEYGKDILSDLRASYGV